MPFDQNPCTSDIQYTATLAVLAISLLEPADQGPAAAALIADCMTEAMVAMMFNVKPETLKKWRTDRIGPPRTTEGNIVLFPIPELRDYLRSRARGAHASQRPPRR